MKLAFSLFNYFPFGGLQRDCLQIAEACAARGHQVHVYTMTWEGEQPSGLTIHLLKNKCLQNHTRIKAFAKTFAQQLQKQRYDLIVGFNKMPHLDVYYAADVCYQARIRRTRSLFSRLSPRYKQQVAFEAEVFRQDASTKILYLSAMQKQEFVHYYQTEPQRFHLLSPGIKIEYKRPENIETQSLLLKKQYGLEQHDLMLLFVASSFKTKGLDRVLQAVAALPGSIKTRCHLLVIGGDKPKRYQKMASKLGLSQIKFLGARMDVANFYWAADLLIHPAYHESAGLVLLEALVAGLPVLTVDACGYAEYIERANAGIVLDSPFKQEELNHGLERMLLSNLNIWRENGLNYAKQADIYNLAQQATDIIEQVGQTRDLLFA